jgi:hypothetical protein
MGTSRSNSWSARVLVFSGRPPPQWPLANADALALIEIWNALPATDHAMPDAPALGYRGCVLEDGSGGAWRAYGGVATSTAQSRTDAERRFERALLATAPAGALPPGLVP